MTREEARQMICGETGLTWGECQHSDGAMAVYAVKATTIVAEQSEEIARLKARVAELEDGFSAVVNP